MFHLNRWYVPVAFAMVSVTTHANGISTLEYQNKQLSVEAVGVPIIQLAAELSRVLGIPVTTTDGQDKPLSLSIFQESLETAIPKITQNSVLVRKKLGDVEEIVEIVFLLDDDSSGGANPNLPSGEPADEIISDDQGVEPDQSAGIQTDTQPASTEFIESVEQQPTIVSQ